SQPIIAKENTISSTNGSGPVRMPHDTIRPRDEAIPEDDDGKFPDSGGIAGRTVLDLPKDMPQDEASHDDQRAWNARSYPSSQPSLVPAAMPEITSYPVVQRDQ